VAKPSVTVALRCFTEAEFLWQHANISLPWQQESVGSSLNEIITLPDPKPSLWYKNLALISYTSQVIANFVFKYPSFCYRGNRGPKQRSRNCNEPSNRQTPKIPFGTKIWELSPMKIELSPIRRLGA